MTFLFDEDKLRLQLRAATAVVPDPAQRIKNDLARLRQGFDQGQNRRDDSFWFG